MLKNYRSKGPIKALLLTRDNLGEAADLIYETEQNSQLACVNGEGLLIWEPGYECRSAKAGDYLVRDLDGLWRPMRAEGFEAFCEPMEEED
jgi:hypothetical protein